MAFHRELREMVDWTWTNRNEIMTAALNNAMQEKGHTHRMMSPAEPNAPGRTINLGIDMIYRHYSAAGNRGQEQPTAIVIENFLRELNRRLNNQLKPEPHVILQTGGAWVELGAFNRLMNRTDIIGSYIHFNKKDGICLERVYINLKEENRGTSFGGIMLKIWGISGVLSVKVAAPGSVGADSAVVYCATSSARKKVISKLKKYQRAKPRHFNGELPKLVASAGVPGVGYGAEPPSKQPMRPDSQTFSAVDASQSFGMYRASLIFIALERTVFPKEVQFDPKQGLNFERIVRNQKKEFEQRVQTLFERGGLSVKYPHKQKKVKFDTEVEVVMPPPAGPPPPPPGPPPNVQRDLHVSL
ncbi:hypothetical protein [uncultured Roseibium sp.]|uniref:hypothetical protein n=1 Tax=uncultured Roseibium sp. TaxID=1936171 RepID=UPI00262ABA26|nr:hypothetical protein [uncultured Roseibium sp.]